MNKETNIIAKFRKEAGYTQKTLAEALNVTDKAVSKWERGICLPDVSLLPKLSLLLDVDIDLLLSQRNRHDTDAWAGVLDLSAYPYVDLSQKVYDKPMVYYMLVHFLLLDITDICILTTRENRDYLDNGFFQKLGMNFFFNMADVKCKNLMIMNRPIFIFGSDLTRQFQGAMVSNSVMTLVPEGTRPALLFCPAEYTPVYARNPDYLFGIASNKTLGRGMVCLDMDSEDRLAELSMFIKMYQTTTGLKIGNLKEIVEQRGNLQT